MVVAERRSWVGCRWSLWLKGKKMSSFEESIGAKTEAVSAGKETEFLTL